MSKLDNYTYTKLDAYESVFERVEQGDWIDAYNDAVRMDSYNYDIWYQLQDLGIIEIKMEVDECKLQAFKKAIEYMRELQDEIDDYKERIKND